jgi:hypothetical protein
VIADYFACCFCFVGADAELQRIGTYSGQEPPIYFSNSVRRVSFPSGVRHPCARGLTTLYKSVPGVRGLDEQEKWFLSSQKQNRMFG